MTNEQNLTRFTSSQSREKAVENGRKGGIASGEAKREKKRMKELCNLALQSKVTKEELKNQIQEIVPDVDPENMTNEFLMVIKQIQSARDGDLKALEFLRDTSGQQVVAKQEVSMGVTSGELAVKFGDDDIGNV